MIAFWILVIIGIVMLIRWLVVSTRKAKGGSMAAESPLDVLKKRYARGEIDKAEFEEKRKDIEA